MVHQPVTTMSETKIVYDDGSFTLDNSLFEAVQTRKNSTGIKDAFKGKQSESSFYMDMAIDEEAIDSLVQMGGNPSFGVHTKFNIDTIDLTRTTIRRLYHGAAEIDKRKLLGAYYMKELFYTSTSSVYKTGKAVRRIKYYKTECDKFDFLVHHFPNVFTYEFSRHAYRFQINNPKWEFKYVYSNSPVLLEDWVKYELAFGRFDRIKHVLINCVRNDKRKITRKKRVLDKYQLRDNMHGIGMDMVRNIISYI